MPYFDKKKRKWVAVFKHGGKRETRLCETNREAKRWESEKWKQASQSKTPTGTALETAYNDYLDYAKARYIHNTFIEKLAIGGRFLRFVGASTAVSEITPKIVQDFILRSAAESSHNRANRDRKNLLAFWNWMVRFYDLPANPVSKSDKLPHDAKEQYVPPEEDILKVLSVCDRKERLFILCYLHTAARRSEIFRLKWTEDVNFERKEIRLGTRKRKDGSMEYEWLPMTEELCSELLWWYGARRFKGSPYLWVVEEGPYAGQPYSYRHKFLPGLCKRAGVPVFKFHALRRYAASILADKFKISSKTIQRILRHKNLSTTEKYIKALSRDLRNTMNLLGE